MLKKYNNIINFIIIFLIIIAVNFISSKVHYRFDLTSDNRYTLKETTVEVLEELDDVIYFKIYLEGDLPLGLKRFQNRIKETLEEFRVHAGENIQYSFINPTSDRNQKERRAFFNDLKSRGLQPTNVKQRDKEGGYSQKIIFPGAIVNYGEKQTAINLLKNNPGYSAAKNLNHSIQNLEYELINAIYELSVEEKGKIAFIEGHNELDKYHVADISNKLSGYYKVDRLNLKKKPQKIFEYKTLVIAKPSSEFSRKDKFFIDQYVMNGGRIIWFIDKTTVTSDSLSRKSSTMAMLNEMNLDDMFFKYGVRFNPVLIKDMQCAVIPVNVSYSSDNPKFAPSPWMYYPLLSSANNHPINKSLNMIRTEFIGSIDTLAVKGQSKEILLRTTENTEIVQAPVLVNLGEVSKKVNPAALNGGKKIVSVLAEGEFQSVFKNRIIKELKKELGDKKFRTKSLPTRMIFVSDGDVIKNEVTQRPDGTYISPLGYDKYTKQTYGNKNFVLNCIHYLTSEKDLISIRGKEIKMRLLDKSKIKEQRLKWQVINILIPVIFILIFGFVKNILRRRKYTVSNEK